MAGVKEIMVKPVDTAERDRYRNVALHAASQVRQFGQPDDPTKPLRIKTGHDAIHIDTYWRPWQYVQGYESFHMHLTAHHMCVLTPKNPISSPGMAEFAAKDIVGGIEQWLYGDVQHHPTAGMVELFAIRRTVADESPEAASLDKAIDSLRKARMLTRP